MTGKPTPKQIEKALANAKASMEIDGFKFTDEELDLIREHLSKETSDEEFLEALNQRFGK